MICMLSFPKHQPLRCAACAPELARHSSPCSRSGLSRPQVVLYSVLQAFYESINMLLRCAWLCAAVVKGLEGQCAAAAAHQNPLSAPPLPIPPAHRRAHVPRTPPHLPPPPLPARRNAVEKKTVLENLDLVLLAMDEIVDGGCVRRQQNRGIRAGRGAAAIATAPAAAAACCPCAGSLGRRHAGVFKGRQAVGSCRMLPACLPERAAHVLAPARPARPSLAPASSWRPMRGWWPRA